MNSSLELLDRTIEQLAQDALRHQEAELKLSEQQDHLRLILTGIGEGIIVTDLNEFVTYLNPVAELKTGWTKAKASGEPIKDIFRIVDNKNKQAISAINGNVRCQSITAIPNYRHALLIHTSGAEIPIDHSAIPLRDRTGKIVGVVVIFVDISERLRLEQLVETRTRELEEEQMRKDRFLSMLAHELRNPLAPIKSALAIQQSTDDVKLHQQAREIMNRQVDHLTRLINGLLDVARVSAGKISLEKTTIDVAKICHEAAELFEPVIHQKDQQFLIELPKQPLYVVGDLSRLIQAVGNVLDNATKYSPMGGMIRLTAIQNSHCVDITVEDKGRGIHPSLLPHIFDVFSQSERTLARSDGGLGIGLTLVKQLIEQHEGSVTVCSEGIEKGSIFTISLPLVPPPVMSKASSTTNNHSQVEKRRILVVDDNLDASSMLSELLQTHGHEVEVAATGNDAITSTMRFHPDIIFLDIGLPDMDGYQVAENIRARPGMTDTLIVAVTGYGRPQDFQRSTESGFNYHLVKPVDINDIVRISKSVF